MLGGKGFVPFHPYIPECTGDQHKYTGEYKQRTPAGGAEHNGSHKIDDNGRKRVGDCGIGAGLAALIGRHHLCKNTNNRRPDKGLYNTVDRPKYQHQPVGMHNTHAEIEDGRADHTDQNHLTRAEAVSHQTAEYLTYTVDNTECGADQSGFALGKALAGNQLRHDRGIALAAEQGDNIGDGAKKKQTGGVFLRAYPPCNG